MIGMVFKINTANIYVGGMPRGAEALEELAE